MQASEPPFSKINSPPNPKLKTAKADSHPEAAVQPHWTDDDTDSNLMFRWDVTKKEEKGFEGDGYVLEMFFLKQRKGIFCPIIILNFEQKDVDNFVSFAQPTLDITNCIRNIFSQTQS